MRDQGAGRNRGEPGQQVLRRQIGVQRPVGGGFGSDPKPPDQTPPPGRARPAGWIPGRSRSARPRRPAAEASNDPVGADDLGWWPGRTGWRTRRAPRRRATARRRPAPPGRPAMDVGDRRVRHVLQDHDPRARRRVGGQERREAGEAARLASEPRGGQQLSGTARRARHPARQPHVRCGRPLCQTVPPATSISGFSAAAFSSVATACSARRTASIAGPCTCGKARYPCRVRIRAMAVIGQQPAARSPPRCPGSPTSCTGAGYGSEADGAIGQGRDHDRARTSASARSQQARAALANGWWAGIAAPARPLGPARTGLPGPGCSQSRSPSRHSALPPAPWISGADRPAPRYRDRQPVIDPCQQRPNMPDQPRAPGRDLADARTTSIARLSSAAISGPPPPAWLRSSRSP